MCAVYIHIFYLLNIYFVSHFMLFGMLTGVEHWVVRQLRCRRRWHYVVLWLCIASLRATCRAGYIRHGTCGMVGRCLTHQWLHSWLRYHLKPSLNYTRLEMPAIPAKDTEVFVVDGTHVRFHGDAYVRDTDRKLEVVVCLCTHVDPWYSRFRRIHQ
jgi:hypothetical protein